MRARWLIVAAVAALSSAGCTTLVEVSAPNGANHAGYSVPEAQGGGPVLSGDGRFSVFTAPRTAGASTLEAFRRDARSGTTARVSSDAAGKAVGGDVPVISRDGRYVVFRTAATLVPGDHNLDPTRGLTGTDWYLKDMNTGTFELLTLDEHGTQLAPGGPDSLAPTAYVSASGRYVAFQVIHAESSIFDSDIYVRDRQAAVTQRVDGGYRALAGLSGDGLHVGVDDYDPCQTFCPPPDPGVHVDDWTVGTTYTIACGAGGRTPMSDDGRLVAVAQTNEDVWCVRGLARYDRSQARPPVMFFDAELDPAYATMSADGNRAAFVLAGNDVAGDTNNLPDVYVSDLAAHSFGVASRTARDAPADGPSTNPWLSADGSIVQFDTTATNLAADDTDGKSDTIATPAVRPTLDRFTAPPTVVRGGSTRIVGFGSGIAPNATVLVDGQGVTISDVSVLDGTEVLFTVSASLSAPMGTRTFVVVNSGPYGVSSGSCSGCLAVTSQ